MANPAFTCTLNTWVSGATIYANFTYSRSGTFPYSDSALPTPTMTIAGTTFSDTDFANRVHSGVNIGSITTTTFSKTVSSNGTYGVTWSCGTGYRSDFAGTWNGSATVSGAATPPGGGYINGVSTYWDSSANEIRVHADSVGVSSTGGASLTGLNFTITDAPYVSGIARRDIAVSSNGAASTLSNSLSTWGGTPIDIGSNKLIYLGLYAANSAGAYRYQGGTIVTAPAPATISAQIVGQDSATFAYSLPSDYGYYSKTVEYSIDGGNTWNIVDTISSSSATTGTFFVTGLTPNEAYTLQSRVRTNAGTTYNASIAFIPKGIAPRLYGSANAETTKTAMFYGPVNSQAARVKKIYCSINGRAYPCFTDYKVRS